MSNSKPVGITSADEVVVKPAAVMAITTASTPACGRMADRAGAVSRGQRVDIDFVEGDAVAVQQDQVEPSKSPAALDFAIPAPTEAARDRPDLVRRIGHGGLQRWRRFRSVQTEVFGW